MGACLVGIVLLFLNIVAWLVVYRFAFINCHVFVRHSFARSSACYLGPRQVHSIDGSLDPFCAALLRYLAEDVICSSGVVLRLVRFTPVPTSYSFVFCCMRCSDPFVSGSEGAKASCLATLLSSGFTKNDILRGQANHMFHGWLPHCQVLHVMVGWRVVVRRCLFPMASGRSLPIGHIVRGVPCRLPSRLRLLQLHVVGVDCVDVCAFSAIEDVSTFFMHLQVYVLRHDAFPNRAASCACTHIYTYIDVTLQLGRSIFSLRLCRFYCASSNQF